MRCILTFAVCSGVLALSIALWRQGREPQSARMQVVSGSMMPHLLGPHFRIPCQNCQHDSVIRADRETQNPVAWRCENCGGNLLASAQTADALSGRMNPSPRIEVKNGGDQLVVTQIRRLPYRLEVVAFLHDDQPYVKRVWGLPGERIHFESGDLFIDGQRFQKSVEQYLQVAVSVAKLSLRGPRWDHPQHASQRSESPATAEHAAAKETEYEELSQGSVRGLKPGETLAYQHLVPSNVYPSETPPRQWMRGARLTDDYTFDRSISYALEKVRDVGIELILAGKLESFVRVTLRADETTIELELTPESSAHTARVATDATARMPSVMVNRHVHIVLCDQRLLLVSDLEKKSIELVAPPGLNSSPVSNPVLANAEPRCLHRLPDFTGFELVNLGERTIKLKEVELTRDLHLRESKRGRSQDANAKRTTYAVPDDAVFLLGDHLLDSSDSREFGAVSTGAIIGSAKVDSPR
ncbi:MAG: S26 family signal peptidase [Aureliella sp.]